MLEISQWENRIHFPPLSDLSENTFGISGLNVASISWNFEWYQLFILVGPGGNRAEIKKEVSGIEISLWYLFYEVSETHDPPEKVYPQSRVKDFWEWKSERIHFDHFPLW